MSIRDLFDGLARRAAEPDEFADAVVADALADALEQAQGGELPDTFSAVALAATREIADSLAKVQTIDRGELRQYAAERGVDLPASAPARTAPAEPISVVSSSDETPKPAFNDPTQNAGVFNRAALFAYAAERGVDLGAVAAKTKTLEDASERSLEAQAAVPPRTRSRKDETTQSAKPERKSVAEEVSERLIEALRAGTAPWQRPWDATQELPYNPTTGNRYRGANVLGLLSKGRSDPRWMTYRQSQDAGYQVRQGEKSTAIEYWVTTRTVDVEDASGKPVIGEDGKPLKRDVLLERPYAISARVFNAAQIDGIEPLVPRKTFTEDEATARAQALIDASGARIENEGVRAYYSPSKDLIRVPEPSRFDTLSAYLDTTLHELGHWSGHQSRLDRDLSGAFGSESYAREELRAEIASMLIAAEVGLPHNTDAHASYVESWVSVLQKDSREIVHAANDAEKIMQYVLQLEQRQQLDQKEGVMPERNPIDPDQKKDFIAVPYSDRLDAKKAGALWDRTAKSWYVPQGIHVDKWPRHTPEAPIINAPEKSQAEQPKRTYLDVPYKARNEARAGGAKWDAGSKSWYVEAAAALEALRHFLPDARTDQPKPPPEVEFATVLRSAGYRLEGNAVMNGKHQRCAVEGDVGKIQSGFYFGFTNDWPAGHYTNNKTGESGNWKAGGYTAEDVGATPAIVAQKSAEREKEREAERAQALAILEARIASAALADASNPYLASKHLEPTAGVRQLGQALLVPLYDVAGTLKSAVYMNPDGTKANAKNLSKAGAFHPIGFEGGIEKADAIVIAEGYSTAVSGHLATRLPTVAALDAGNLLAVATALRTQYPDKPFIFLADDDHHLTQREVNPLPNRGVVDARSAAKAVGLAQVVLPRFSPAHADVPLREKTDFDDLRQLEGNKAVVKQLLPAVLNARNSQGRSMALDEEQQIRLTDMSQKHRIRT